MLLHLRCGELYLNCVSESIHICWQSRDPTCITIRHSFLGERTGWRHALKLGIYRLLLIHGHCFSVLNCWKLQTPSVVDMEGMHLTEERSKSET